MIEEAKELNELIEDRYVPTALERKKALLMYFLVGVIISLTNINKSKYEIYHLKQATGWWLIFFFTLVFAGFLFFIPFINIIAILLFLILISVWIFFVKQARGGFYTIGDEKIFLPFFSGIGSWVMLIFEVEEEDKEKDLVIQASKSQIAESSQGEVQESKSGSMEENAVQLSEVESHISNEQFKQEDSAESEIVDDKEEGQTQEQPPNDKGKENISDNIAEEQSDNNQEESINKDNLQQESNDEIDEKLNGKNDKNEKTEVENNL